MPVSEEYDREAEASRVTLGEATRIWEAAVVVVLWVVVVVGGEDSMFAFGGLPSRGGGGIYVDNCTSGSG